MYELCAFDLSNYFSLPTRLKLQKILRPTYTFLLQTRFLSAAHYVLISLLTFTMIRTISFFLQHRICRILILYSTICQILYKPVQHNVEFQSRSCFLKMEYIDHFHYSICSASVQNFCHQIVENETPRPLMIGFHPVSKGKVACLVIYHQIPSSFLEFYYIHLQKLKH